MRIFVEDNYTLLVEITNVSFDNILDVVLPIIGFEKTLINSIRHRIESYDDYTRRYSLLYHIDSELKHNPIYLFYKCENRYIHDARYLRLYKADEECINEFNKIVMKLKLLNI